MQLHPYLFFNGRCEEALEFYKTALGAEVAMMMRFKENPDQPSADCAPVDGDKIMHACIKFHGVTLFASDGMTSGQPDFKGFSLSLTVKDEAEAHRIFDALAAGGQTGVPLCKTFFSPCFGMVTDRFGLGWMVMVEP